MTLPLAVGRASSFVMCVAAASRSSRPKGTAVESALMITMSGANARAIGCEVGGGGEQADELLIVIIVTRMIGTMRRKKK